MIKLDNQYQPILLEAVEDLMYKLSLQLEDLKGGPLDKARKDLTEKQALAEELQHLISTS